MWQPKNFQLQSKQALIVAPSRPTCGVAISRSVLLLYHCICMRQLTHAFRVRVILFVWFFFLKESGLLIVPFFIVGNKLIGLLCSWRRFFKKKNLLKTFYPKGIYFIVSKCMCQLPHRVIQFDTTTLTLMTTPVLWTVVSTTTKYYFGLRVNLFSKRLIW